VLVVIVVAVVVIVVDMQPQRTLFLVCSSNKRQTTRGVTDEADANCNDVPSA